MGAARAGDEAKVGFRQAEFRVHPKHDHVGHEGKLKPSAERKAIDGGDKRFWKGADRGPMALARVNRTFGGRLALDLGDVGAGGEIAVRAADQGGADGGVGGGLGQGLGQAGQNGGVERVLRFGAVQGEFHPAGMLFDNDLFHALTLRSCGKLFKIEISSLKLFSASDRLGPQRA